VHATDVNNFMFLFQLQRLGDIKGVRECVLGRKKIETEAHYNRPLDMFIYSYVVSNNSLVMVFPPQKLCNVE
jgi:hypothetical protein